MLYDDRIKVRVGDIFEFDEDEFYTIDEFIETISWENDFPITKELIDWCKKTINSSFKVDEVVYYDYLTTNNDEKNLNLKNKVFYNNKFTELNIPTPFKDVWLTVPIECLTKIDVS